MKKAAVIIIAILLILGAGGLVAYHFLSGSFNTLSHQITSADGAYTMRVPFRWDQQEPTNTTVLSAQSSDASEYAGITVTSESLADGQTMEDYVYAYISGIAGLSDNSLVQVTSVAPTQMQMGANSGYYFELDTVSSGIVLHTWDFVFATQNGYVHVNVASEGDKQSEFAEIAKNIICSVTAS